MEMKVIKRNQSELKNIISEMRSILNGINKVNKEKDQMAHKEYGKANDTQSE